MMVTFEPSMKDLTKSSKPGFRNTSSTNDSNQATHRAPNRTHPEKPFLFFVTLNSTDPFTTKKMKDLASALHTLPHTTAPKGIRNSPAATPHMADIQTDASFPEQLDLFGVADSSLFLTLLDKERVEERR
jgi:penicillin V acylase-like amidase (Ntn superfamily)